MNNWQDIATAPKDGSEIEVAYDNDLESTSTAIWSDNPICMLGARAGSHPPGWATGPNSGTDFNLPIDPPTHWRPIQ